MDAAEERDGELARVALSDKLARSVGFVTVTLSVQQMPSRLSVGRSVGCMDALNVS